MNFLRKMVAEKRRPDNIDRCTLKWILTKNRFIEISLICFVDSEDRDDYRPSDRPHALVLLEGEYLLVQRRPWLFSPDGDTDVIELIDARDIRVFNPTDLYHVELFPPETTEEAMLDMPAWMGHSDVRFNTKSQAWFLYWSWTWNPLKKSP